MLRVLIVDDSFVFRAALKTAFESDPDIQVIGQAGSGAEAVDLVTHLEPDLITMDVVMPGLDGFETVRRIMAQRPTPILVVSDLQRETIVFRMLAAGALDVITKPGVSPASMQLLIAQVKSLAAARPLSPPVARPKLAPDSAPVTPLARPPVKPGTGPVVILVSSAGGPPALAYILNELPVDLPAGLIIVQHIAAGFARGLAEWLDHDCRLQVRLAEADQVLRPGLVMVAPDGAHLVLAPGRRILLDANLSASGFLRPAADITLRSAADVCGADLLAVVLTGMGRDGALGAEAVKTRGGCVAVQDQTTSAVYGMPQAARPFADVELPLGDIPAYIVRFAYEHSG